MEGRTVVGEPFIDINRPFTNQALLRNPTHFAPFWSTTRRKPPRACRKCHENGSVYQKIRRFLTDSIRVAYHTPAGPAKTGATRDTNTIQELANRQSTRTRRSRRLETWGEFCPRSTLITTNGNTEETGCRYRVERHRSNATKQKSRKRIGTTHRKLPA